VLALTRIAKGTISGVSAIGLLLIAVGTVAIEGAQYKEGPFIPIDTPGPIQYHYEWDESRLLLGIILDLAGMAIVSASMTYLFLTGKRKGG
jgi:hypothetical protein